MELIEGAPIPGVRILVSAVHHDARGHVIEGWRASDDLPGTAFVQDNFASSRRGVVRGLHYQLPGAQGKLVRAITGTVWDVVVDLRRASRTFGRWAAVRLVGGDGRALWVPPGLAHGFVVCSERADVAYKLTAPRMPEAERVLRWDDPTLGIPWPQVGEPILSLRDRDAPGFADVPVFDPDMPGGEVEEAPG